MKFPAYAPKHRRAGVIQRMSLQCSLSYQNEAFCLQLGLRNSRVVWMKHSRTLQPLPEPRCGKFQPKDPSLAEEEEGAQGSSEVSSPPGVPWNTDISSSVHAGGLCWLGAKPGGCFPMDGGQIPAPWEIFQALSPGSTEQLCHQHCPLALC